MKSDQATMEILWTGPYGWPEFEGALPVLPAHGGVYLLTAEYEGGYLIYAAGHTGRPMRARFAEHTREYMSGEYNVLDIGSMQRGARQEIWQGWGWSPEKRAAFAERRPCIIDAVGKQLAGFRIFVADVGTEKRIRERIEAAVMGALYNSPSPLCDIPDKGMFLAPRWNSEQSAFATNSCPVKLHGLPARFEI